MLQPKKSQSIYALLFSEHDNGIVYDMTKYRIGDRSYGGFTKGDIVRVDHLVDPDSAQGRRLFYGLVSMWMDGRSVDVEGKVGDFIPDGGDNNGNRPEPLVCVENPALPFPQCLAAYACNELVIVTPASGPGATD